MTNETRLIGVIDALATRLEHEDFVIDKTGVKLVELLGHPVLLDPTQPNLDFGVRKTPLSYVNAELEWYKSQDLSVVEISKHAKIWADVAARDGTVNSNYGWCIFSDENGRQYEHVVEELRAQASSRRAVMIYNRPSMWYDYNRDGMNDFMCTFATQHFIRGNALCTIVNMRSNDFVFGFFNDFAWQCWVHMQLMESLSDTYPGLQTGNILWLANSLHVYERHFDMLRKLGRWARSQGGK